MPSTMEATEIKQIRAALGLTGDELAEKLGVTGNTVRRWECGIRQAKGPAVTILRRMQAEARRRQPAAATA
jgi:DNA-binding transcriptional regulator YiaG